MLGFGLGHCYSDWIENPERSRCAPECVSGGCGVVMAEAYLYIIFAYGEIKQSIWFYSSFYSS